MTEKQITAIRAQKHNPDRLNIELDGEYAFGLSRIVAAWLKVGDKLSEERITSLTRSDASEFAYQKALHFLDYRPRTEKEIRQKLQQKGFESEDIDRVLQKLQNANLVQDQQFAQMWVENRNEFHPRGKRLMRLELRSKGISDEMIGKALADSVEEDELAYRAAAKYARRLDPGDRLTFRKKMCAYLARQGFSYGTISPVIQRVITSFEQSQSDILENEDEDNGTD
jgi:regulatory protein